jgi:hypothetical protein
MTKTHLARALVMLLLLSPTVFASADDLSGKWAGTFVVTHNGQTSNDTAHMVAKQTGADLTGTIGPNADEQWPILKGKIATTKVEGKDVTNATFDVQVGGDTSGPLAHFALTLSDGHLKGNAKAEQGGETMDAVIDLQRIK